MKNNFIIVLLLLLCSTSVTAQTVLATFEDNSENILTIDTQSTDASLFLQIPAIVENPDTTGINKSIKCLGAINVANADWNKNFVKLKLSTPIVISNQMRFLSFLVYREAQPKNFRIGINGYDDTHEIYQDKILHDATWERVVIDLMSTEFAGQTLNSLYIIFSCNWDNPRNGWENIFYAFDDFAISGSAKVVKANILIDPTESYQEIEYFGASDCWAGGYIGNRWEKKINEYIAEKLFSREFDSKGNPIGIGLSNWRINVGSGSADLPEENNITEKIKRTECFLQADGSYDWNKQAGHQYYMQKAKEYGVEQMVLFSNSPPVQFTQNGKAYANLISLNANLKSDKYDDYAEFLATVGEHFRNQGYNIRHISPVNEPQYTWSDANQEGSPWTNSNIHNIVQELDKSLQARKSPIKILIGEAGKYTDLYTGSLFSRATNQIEEFFSPSSNNYIGNLPSVEHGISAHSYWTFQTRDGLTDLRQETQNAVAKAGLKLYQTEWSMLDEMPATNTGFPQNYNYHDIAIFTAKIIHYDLVYAGVSGWDYWTAMASEVYGHLNRFLLIRTTPGNGTGGYEPYGDFDISGKAEATPSLWALGHYSRFIRPGYKRIRLEGADVMTQLLGSAYMSPDSSEMVIVLINGGAAQQEVFISIPDSYNKKPSSIKRYMYNSKTTSGITRASSPAEDDVEATILLTAYSINTIIYDFTPKENNDNENSGDNEDSSFGSTTKNDYDIAKIIPNHIKSGDNIKVIVHENNAMLRIYTLSGKRVYQKYVSKGQSIINPHLSHGMYIYEITATGFHTQGKFWVK